MSDDEQNPVSDAATRLWQHLEAVDGNHVKRTARYAKRGELLYQLRCLYSERESGSSRRSSGHGTFQRECIARGYKPRRVREWVRDHEVRIGLRPPKESTAEKRKARRLNSSAEYERGYRAAMNDFPTASGHTAGPVSDFAGLLPFEVLRSAYRVAAKLFHPDLGGDSEQMQRLNAAWAQVEESFKSAGGAVYDAPVSSGSYQRN